MGGDIERPTYELVSQGNTNHVEVVNLFFNQELISYERILSIFWQSHNPTTLNRQGNDVGTQYRSVIFYYSEHQKELADDSFLLQQKKWRSPIVTQVLPATKYYRAEEYHQNYLNKNNSVCGI